MRKREDFDPGRDADRCRGGSPPVDRRLFLQGVLGGAAAAALPACRPETPGSSARTNVLFITADDMNQESAGVYGCRVPDVTPSIDRLAAEGMRFDRAHVTVSSCQPSRTVWMTGRYPHQSGTLGFGPVAPGVPTLIEILRDAGYRTGILSKVDHLEPRDKFRWDYRVAGVDLGRGRDPARFHDHALRFLRSALRAGHPFFLMANADDPHRPFPGSREERKKAVNQAERGTFPGVRRTVAPTEVEVPAFLPDLPAVRAELAEYYTAVHRADETAGAVLAALAKSGLVESTLVLFLSDNGMPFPFAKSCCYRFSTRTPCILRWPGRIEPGRVDAETTVTGLDLLPTLLAALDLEAPPELGGRSLLPTLRGGELERLEHVYSSFHETSTGRSYPTRAVHDRRHGYLYNAWSRPGVEWLGQVRTSRTFEAMEAAAGSDAALAARLDHLLRRAPEELYDYERDPGAHRNLAGEPASQELLAGMRRRMAEHLMSTGDPLLSTYRRFLAG